MSLPLRRRDPWTVRPLAAVAFVLTVAIFALDTVTPREIAMAAFYVVVVLLAMRFLEPRGVTLAAAGCIGLAVISFLLTPRGAQGAGLWNLVIGATAIVATTYLARKLVVAEAAAHEARAQLARLARITVLGELTASIAHEVNQPLTAVIASGDAGLRWLAAEPPNVPRARRAVERMIADANRASDIVGRVRAMAKGAPAQKQVISLNEAARQALALAEGDLRRGEIAVRTSFALDDLAVQADPVQLQQLVLNLIANAAEALAEVQDRARELVIVTEAAAREVRVTVSDNGVGLASGDSQEIFQPFFTSKPGGMGIGLSISRSIIEAHGGRIWAVRNEPHGVSVHFTLPALEA